MLHQSCPGGPPVPRRLVALRRTALAFRPLLLALVVLGCTGGEGSGAGRRGPAGPTEITVQKRVLVADCVPFGINLSYGNDSYRASPWTRDRIREGFEGSTYRQCLTGQVRDENGMSLWVDTPEWWREIHIGARYTVLNGPGRGTAGTIRDIRTVRKGRDGRRGLFPYYVLDRRLPPAPKRIGLPGLLVERFRLDEGHILRIAGDPSGFWFSSLGQEDVTPRVEIAIGDVRPGAPGRAACALIAPDESAPAHVRFAALLARLGECNGRWRVTFSARARAGEPALEVLALHSLRAAPPAKPALDRSWKRYELEFDVEGVPDPDWTSGKPGSALFFLWRVAGGEVLIDEIGAERLDESNPTPFRDDLIATLKRLRPGSLRNIQQGGSTFDNCLAGPTEAHVFTSLRGQRPGPYAQKQRHPFSMHEFFQLCAHAGCDPWYCLPGTLHPEEVERFVEYVGAPADRGYGKRRAELGQERPWTEVFRSIHVEFGNEAWNSGAPYHSGGFDGSDYWEGLITRAKASPHMRENILFHAGGQARSPSRNRGILPRVPSCDRFAIAPYLLTHVTREDLASHPSDADLLRWVLAWPIYHVRHPDGFVRQNAEIAAAGSKELSVYEINHHTLEADGVPLETRKKIFTTLAGGLSVVHTMLLMLREHGVRVQNAFPLASGSDHGIWDFVLSMREGHERYRPSFLAMSLANRAIRGQLLETRHEGGDPRFATRGAFHTNLRGRSPEISYGDIPCLWSYAFRDGKEWAVIIVNLDVERELPVVLRIPTRPEGGEVRSALLAADSVVATNEWEVGKEQVTVRESKIPVSGPRLSLEAPACSLRVVSWRAR